MGWNVTFGEGSVVVAFEDVGSDVAGNDLEDSGQKILANEVKIVPLPPVGNRTYGGHFDSVHPFSEQYAQSRSRLYPSGAISTLSVFAQCARAALVALYDAACCHQLWWPTTELPCDQKFDLHPYMYGTIPPTEPMLTMVPCALINRGWKWCTIRMGPKTLTLNIFCTSRTSVSMPVIV